MCGIVYAHDFTGNPVNNFVLDTFDNQRHRGTQGFGLFDGQEMNMAHAAKEDKILNWLVKYDSNLIMFHHRYPTSTVNVKRAAHPFSTKDYFGDTQYILVHNGSISNAYELYDEHTELGIEYKSLLQDGTFNDSEALLWDFALFMEGKQKELKVTGGIAFVCIRLNKGKLEKMYFGRNSNPLKLYRNKNGISLSSEGIGEEIDEHTIYTWNYSLNRLTKRKVTIPRFKVYTSETWNSTNWSNNSYTNWSKNDWKDDKYAKDINQIFDKNELGRAFGRYLEAKNYNEDDYLTDEERRIIKYSPSPSEVENVAMGYLTEFEGHIQDAYQAVEDDYDAVYYDDNMPIDEMIQEQLMLEKVLEYFELDPDFGNDIEISSTWSALWQQQNLL